MIRILDSNEDTRELLNTEDFLTEVKKIFSQDGLLEQALGFEFRAEQAEMAIVYAQSLISGKHLIFEAGTGVGEKLGVFNTLNLTCPS